MSRMIASIRAAFIAIIVGMSGLSCASAGSSQAGSTAPAPATRGIRAGAPPAVAGGSAATIVPIRTVLRTLRSCHGDGREELVLQSAEDWQRWRERASCGASSAEPVDFAREFVVAVGDHVGSNACHSIEIVGAAGDSDGLVVDVVRHVPAKDAICAAMLVHPAHAVAVPRHAGSVRFTWRDDGGGAAR